MMKANNDGISEAMMASGASLINRTVSADLETGTASQAAGCSRPKDDHHDAAAPGVAVPDNCEPKTTDDIFNPRGDIKFPIKLHEMLQGAHREECTHMVSWSPDGKSFRVQHRTLFTEQILPRYFTQTKYRSFQRQLNHYGFDRIIKGPFEGGYRHPDFLRHDPTRCHSMRRLKRDQPKTTSTSTIKKKGSQDQHENHREHQHYDTRSLAPAVSPEPSLFRGGPSSDFDSKQREGNMLGTLTGTTTETPQQFHYHHPPLPPYQEARAVMSSVSPLPTSTGAGTPTPVYYHDHHQQRPLLPLASSPPGRVTYVYYVYTPAVPAQAHCHSHDHQYHLTPQQHVSYHHHYQQQHEPSPMMIVSPASSFHHPPRQCYEHSSSPTTTTIPPARNFSQGNDEYSSWTNNSSTTPRPLMGMVPESDDERDNVTSKADTTLKAGISTHRATGQTSKPTSSDPKEHSQEQSSDNNNRCLGDLLFEFLSDHEEDGDDEVISALTLNNDPAASIRTGAADGTNACTTTTCTLRNNNASEGPSAVSTLPRAMVPRPLYGEVLLLKDVAGHPSNKNDSVLGSNSVLVEASPTPTAFHENQDHHQHFSWEEHATNMVSL